MRGALALAVLVATAGCATVTPPTRQEVHTRADGEVVTCTKPADALLGTDEAAGLSAAFPSIVQTLMGEGPAAGKIGAILPATSTPTLLDILAYRVCLEYGEGVLPAVAYRAWTQDVLPGLERRVRPGGR